MLLYYRGNFTCNENNIAIVGARKASPYGKNVAESLAKDLAKAGVTIISGAARGIDTASHRGALDAKGKSKATNAVLGCGVDIVYPAENRSTLSLRL